MKSQIKQVPSFQTSDGKLHETRLEALQHQFELDLRALFSSASAVAWSPNTAAFVVVKKFNEIDALMRSYRPRINAALAAAQKQAQQAAS